MAMVDVTIRGAGAFGLSIAWACVQRGARVRVIDPGGVGAGSSGGIVGALAPHVPENWNVKKAFQLESLLMGETFWHGVEAASGLSSGFGRTGRLQPLVDEAALRLAKTRAQGAQTLWQGRASWDIVEAKGQSGIVPPSPTGLLIKDTLSGRLHPAQACAALAGAITARGGEIARDGLDEGAVVWATGWHGLTELNAQNGRMVGAGVKGQAALLDFAATDAPQVFVSGLHVIPHADGTTAIGSTTERDFDTANDTDAQVDDLVERAKTLLPVLADAPVIKRWAGVRPRSRTRAPMLGPHPFRKDAFLANGGFKIGFGMAPLAGEVMADLVLDGRNRIPAEFDPAASL